MAGTRSKYRWAGTALLALALAAAGAWLGSLVIAAAETAVPPPTAESTGPALASPPPAAVPETKEPPTADAKPPAVDEPPPRGRKTPRPTKANPVAQDPAPQSVAPPTLPESLAHDPGVPSVSIPAANDQVAPPPAADAPVAERAVRPASAAGADPLARPLPSPLDRPLASPPTPPPETPAAVADGALVTTPVDAPLGFTGRSGILPREVQQDAHFVPREDRWRIGFPSWDRYDKGHPCTDDYPYVEGHWWDPFNQNVLKGDYPILGQHTFLELTGTSHSVFELRQIPTATSPFESTEHPFQNDFFGKNTQFAYSQFFSLSIDLFHGDAAFRPVDWRVKVTPVFNISDLQVNELGVINPDVSRGTTRSRTYLALEEWFVESKLADLSPDYDFVSVRAGSQPFTSDFRGFIFSDTNRAVRLFGTNFSNRDQFNLIYFDQFEKDTNSELNTTHNRHQQVLIANYYRQDFIFPGYTAQASVHYNHDDPSFQYDTNNFLVRPDAVGVFKPHSLDVAYLGWTGDGHINKLNITHAFYWALGYDSLNPMAGQAQDINAQMAAIELSYDRDWMRFRTSFFWASGDENPNNRHATGFDAIMDNPNFAGGEFSYWQRQAIPLFGVNLTNRGSLLPDLRSSKLEGQSNFVNPGLYLANVGIDMELTPKWRLINNLNFLWFDSVQVLRQFVFQENIHQYIGADLSMGVEYRPLLSNNIICTFGIATLIPGQGFRDLYDSIRNSVNPPIAAFADLVLTF